MKKEDIKYNKPDNDWADLLSIESEFEEDEKNCSKKQQETIVKNHLMPRIKDAFREEKI